MTTTTLSEAQLVLKEQFDEIDAAYAARLQNRTNPDHLAIARIKAYAQAYSAYRLQLEAPRQ